MTQEPRHGTSRHETPQHATARHAAARTGTRRTATSRTDISNSPYRTQPMGTPARLALAAVALAALVAVILAIRSCASSGGSTKSATAEDEAAAIEQAYAPEIATDDIYDWSAASASSDSPASWEDLTVEDGHYAIQKEGQVVSTYGIDVSQWQGTIDWQAVADDGVQFAIIRLGFRYAASGEIDVDEAFATNMAGAEEAGMERGVYFFSQAVSTEEAIEEAEFVLEQLGGATLEYPVVFDFEDIYDDGRASAVTTDELTQIATAFCEVIAAAGYQPAIYVSTTNTHLIDVDALGTWPIWYATGGNVPEVDYTVALWQFSETGRVGGIDGDVDLDLSLAGAL